MSTTSASSKDTASTSTHSAQTMSKSVSVHPILARTLHIRDTYREFWAELLGTTLFVAAGTCGNLQGTLFDSDKVSPSSAGSWLSVAAGWGAGLAGAVYLTAKAGGHLNPAVTLAFAISGRFSWRKVPLHIIAQVLGAIAGAAISFGIYHGAINSYEGGSNIRSVPGTAGLFGTYPSPLIGNGSAFFEEVLGALILMVMILTTIDKRNGGARPAVAAATIGLTLFALGMFLGPQTGFSFNPARDFGPRVLTAMVGYGKEVFTYRSCYWIWGGILAPIIGATIATILYDFFIGEDTDSIFSFTYSSKTESKEIEITGYESV